MNKSKFYVISWTLWNINDISPNMIEKILDTKLLFVEYVEEVKMIFEILKIDYKWRLIQFDSHHYEIELSDYNKKLIKNTLDNWDNFWIFEAGGAACFQDPWYKLVEYVYKLNKNNNLIDIIPVPGTSALMTAISVSWLNMDRFTFAWFLWDNSENEVINSKLPIVYFVDINIDLKYIDSYLWFMSSIKNKQAFIWINLWKRFWEWFENKENIIITWNYKEVYEKLILFFSKVNNENTVFKGWYVCVIIFYNK